VAGLPHLRPVVAVAAVLWLPPRARLRFCRWQGRARAARLFTHCVAARRSHRPSHSLTRRSTTCLRSSRMRCAPPPLLPTPCRGASAEQGSLTRRSTRWGAGWGTPWSGCRAQVRGQTWHNPGCTRPHHCLLPAVAWHAWRSCCPRCSALLPQRRLITPARLGPPPPLACSRACGSTLGPGTATKALTGAPLGPAGLPENLVGGIASVMFQLPIARHNYAWAGCMPAGARSRTRARRLVCGGVRVLEGAWQIAQSCRRVCGGC